MRRIGFFMMVIFAAISGLSVHAAPMPRTEETNIKRGVVKAWRLGDTNYCHLKFPPVKKDTLFSDRPELSDPQNTTLIDYYGPCDHDPLGVVEIEKQQDELQRSKRTE